MGVQRVIYCDGPTHGDMGGTEDGCQCHVSTATPEPYVPSPFIRCVEGQPSKHPDHVVWFCGWACAMRYAAQQPVPITVPMHDEDDE